MYGQCFKEHVSAYRIYLNTYCVQGFHYTTVRYAWCKLHKYVQNATISKPNNYYFFLTTLPSIYSLYAQHPNTGANSEPISSGHILQHKSTLLQSPPLLLHFADDHHITDSPTQLSKYLFMWPHLQVQPWQREMDATVYQTLVLQPLAKSAP